MQIGAKLPNSGELPLELGVPTLARTLEDAGFDSLWVSDHIVFPAAIDSPYPFAADGRATWPATTPYLDALVALALAAAVTERVRLGTAVLVLPLRHPVIFAKQAASIDVASGGRLELGLGAGWLREEFDALAVPFAGRGARLEEWIGLARACWTGRPPAHASDRYELPDGVLCLPGPAHELPILLGGHSTAALERAGRVADGWLAQQSAAELDPEAIARAARTIEEAAAGAGRSGYAPRIVLRIVGSAGQAEAVAEQLPALALAGVGEVIVDVPFDGDGPARALACLRGAVPT